MTKKRSSDHFGTSRSGTYSITHDSVRPESDLPYTTYIKSLGEADSGEDEEELRNSFIEIIKASVERTVDFQEGVQAAEVEIEDLSSETIDEATLTDISDLFRETFANQSDEYGVCTKCDFRIRAADAYGVDRSNYLSLTLLDAFQLNKPCPCCDQKMTLFYDPKKTRREIEKKLAYNAKITLLRSTGKTKRKCPDTDIIEYNDEMEGKIMGMVIGLTAPLKRIFELEWKNPYPYVAEGVFNEREELPFFDKVGEIVKKDYPDINHGIFSEYNQFFYMGCTIIHPQLMNRKYLVQMFRSFFAQFTEEDIIRLPAIAETVNGSQAYLMMKNANAVPIEGVIDRGYSIMVGRLSNMVAKVNRSTRKPNRLKIEQA